MTTATAGPPVPVARREAQTAASATVVPKSVTAASTRAAGDDDLFRQEKVGGLVMAARMAQRRGQPGEARTKLQQAFALNQNDCGALELLGDIFMEEAEQEKAIKVFERGLQHHPRHAPFEEKIALCHLDLEEMRRDRELKTTVLDLGDKDRWLDRKPGIAVSLSLLVPGAGQLYNGEVERGAAFLAASSATFCAWYFPLTAAVKGVTSAGVHHLSDLTSGLSAMSGAGKFGVGLMVVLWTATYMVSAIDGLLGAERANQERRRGYGI